MDQRGAYWRCGVCDDVTNGAPRCVLCARRYGRRRIWLKLLLALMIGLAWGISCKAAFAGVEQQIQPLLDQGRTVKLAPNAVYRLDAPLRVPSRARLIGGGFGTVLEYAGPGETAIVLGDAELSAYAWEIESLRVRGGGVFVARCSNRCRLRDVWVANAPGPGLTIDGPGDRLVVEGLDVSGCAIGVAIRGRRANNGLLFRDCAMSGNRGAGLLAETLDWHTAHLEGLRLEHCTIQGNGTGAVGTSAEVILRGLVHSVVIEDTHFESPFSGCGLRLESNAPFPSPVNARQVRTRAPVNVVLRGSPFQPTLPTAAAIEVRAMEGAAGSLRLEDCWLRMPIRAAPGTPAVQQTGPRRQEVEVLGFEHQRPP